VVVGSCVVLAAASCGGGERPPPESNVTPNPDSGSSSGSLPPGTELITGLEEGPEGTGLYFGDKGFVNCGKQAPEKTLILNNPTNDIINFEVKLTAGEEYYTVNPLKGGVPIGGTAVIKIVPNAIPQNSEVTPDLYAGTLELKTSPSQPPTTIRLHQTARGAIVTTNPTSMDFGSVRIGSPVNRTLTLMNKGNVAVTANLSVTSSAFSIEGAASGSVTLAPGGALGSKDIVLSPTEAKSYDDTLTVSFDPSVAHCAPPPSTISLKGQGSISVGVSPGTLQFGLVDCGTAGAAQTVTISSTSAMNFTPTLGKSAASPYTLADASGNPIALGSSIPVPAASTYELRVVPKTIALPASTTAGAFDDTLTITTDIPTDSPHNVQLRETARGAVFVLEPQTINVTGTINETKTNNFTLRNNGNAPAPYQITVSPASTFTSNLTSGTLQGGGTAAGVLTTRLPSTYSTQVNGTIQVTSTGGVLCADLPSPITLSATTGAGTSVTVTPTSLNFGQVNCGTAAPFQTVQISTITTTTTFRPTLNLGNGSPYTLADNNGNPITLGSDIPISPGTPYTLRVVPKTVPIPSSTANNALADTLTITSPADTATKTVTLSQTARGAIFSLTPTTIDFGTSTTKDFQLVNSGNAAANYTIVVTGPFTSNRSTGSASPGTLAGTVTKTGTGTGTLSVTSSDVLCADLPPPVNLVANP
jgi:hypothetical protein